MLATNIFFPYIHTIIAVINPYLFQSHNNSCKCHMAKRVHKFYKVMLCKKVILLINSDKVSFYTAVKNLDY